MSQATDSRSKTDRARRLRAAFRDAGGFNLVELMVTITLISILMAIGVPSYRYVTNSNRVATEVNSLLGDMMAARSEAIRQGLPVTICPSDDGATCKDTTHWENGWILFSDFNADGAVDAAPPQNDTIVRYQTKFANAGGNNGDQFVATNLVNNWVTFNRDGFATNLNTNGTIHALFKLTTNPTNSQWTRCLEVQMAGQMTTEHAGTGAC
jgi:type IV fimbrial biogenesis protein FimT